MSSLCFYRTMQNVGNSFAQYMYYLVCLYYCNYFYLLCACFHTIFIQIPFFVFKFFCRPSCFLPWQPSRLQMNNLKLRQLAICGFPPIIAYVSRFVITSTRNLNTVSTLQKNVEHFLLFNVFSSYCSSYCCRHFPTVRWTAIICYRL